jgi:hypothetical protein
VEQLREVTNTSGVTVPLQIMNFDALQLCQPIRCLFYIFWKQRVFTPILQFSILMLGGKYFIYVDTSALIPQGNFDKMKRMT